MDQYYPIDKAVNTYRLLEKLEPPKDQNYIVYAYILFEKPVDGLHGYHIYLGAYPTSERAIKRVQEIIDLTGHQTIYATKASQWEAIDEIHKPDRTQFITPSIKKQINGDLDTKYYENLKQEQEKEQKRKRIVKEIEEQQENESKADTIDHYARNWFLAITNYSKQMYHVEQKNHFEKMFEKRRQQIREQFIKQPKYEEDWLNIYEYRLTERGEENVFKSIKAGHDELYDNILGDLLPKNENDKQIN